MEPTYGLPSLDTAEFDAMRECFLSRIPDFGDFRDRSSYWEQERAYKDELSRVFRANLTPELFPAETTPSAADQVVQMVLQVLTREKLVHADGKVQNILGWRYSDFLRRLQGDEPVRFARAFGDLLFGPDSSPERVERFTSALWPIWQRIESGNPYALARFFPTVFLMLFDPEHDIAVRADLFSRASRSLLHRRILRSEPFDADAYRAILSFSEAVRRHLAAWAWRPRDLVDVHSFLWVVTRSDDSYGDDAASESPSVTDGDGTPMSEDD